MNFFFKISMNSKTPFMRIIFAFLLFASFSLQAQEKKPGKPKWRIDKNKIITGSLVLVAGSAKGFNETLHFNYKAFENTFPGINENWFNPQVSWRNKYKGDDPDNGPKFFLSTSELNEVILKAIESYHPPVVRGHPVKIKYVTQLPTAVPSFAMFCNFPDDVKQPYKNYIENQLRANFNFKGVPIRLFFRKK